MQNISSKKDVLIWLFQQCGIIHPAIFRYKDVMLLISSQVLQVSKRVGGGKVFSKITFTVVSTSVEIEEKKGIECVTVAMKLFPKDTGVLHQALPMVRRVMLNMLGK